MKFFILTFVLILFYVEGEGKGFESALISTSLEHFIKKEALEKDSVYVYNNWDIQEIILDSKINFVETISDSINKIIIFIDPPIVVEDKIAIRVGYVNKDYEERSKYYIFKYKSKNYQLVDSSYTVSKKWNDFLYFDVLSQLIKDKYNRTDTIFIKTFIDIDFPSIFNGNVIVDLSDNEKSNIWYCNRFNNEKGEPFYLNEILPVSLNKKGKIKIKIRKKIIVDYDKILKIPNFFIVSKAWDTFTYQVKYLSQKDSYTISSIFD